MFFFRHWNEDFQLLTQILRDLLMEIEETVGGYVSQILLTNAYFGYGGYSLIFYGGKKCQFWAKILTRF